MDNHPFFSFDYTGRNNSTGEINVRTGIINATSSSQSSNFGDLFPKNYNYSLNIKQILYNYKKPHSVPFDKLRDFTPSEYQKINSKSNSVDDLTKYNNKCSTVIKNHLLSKLNLKQNLIFSDPITGEKHTFLIIGDFKDYFDNNPSMITKLLTDPSISKEMRFKLLSLFCENEDLLFSSYYDTSTSLDRIEVTETSTSELEIIK